MAAKKSLRKKARTTKKKSTATKKTVAASKAMAETLLVGIDLGTSRSAISPSRGSKQIIESYVGWPKDFVSAKALGTSILFGKEALKNRLSLDLYRPLEHGVIKESTTRDQEAILELIRHLIELVEPDKRQAVNAVVGVPAEALTMNKLAIKEAIAESVDALMVVSEPFAVAYGQNLLNDAMVIDIGAGTVDFCIMHGSVPSDDDQRTILTAGDYIDQQLYDALKENHPDASFNINMVRQFKEQYSYVGEPGRKVRVDIPVGGKTVQHDITEEMRHACESILPAIVEHAVELIAKFDPEFQDVVRENIILAGGGSQIHGIAEYLQGEFQEYGPAQVTRVTDPLFAGSDGALALAKDMPAEYWETL